MFNFLVLGVHWLLETLEQPLRGAARQLGRLRVRWPVAITVRGRRLAADAPDRVVALLLSKWGLLGREEEFLMRRLVRPGMLVLDIGANIGYYTVVLAELAGPTGRVDAFEPDPANFSWLEKNTAANGCGTVRCLNSAVTDRTGTLDLYYCEEHRGDHRIYDSGDDRPTISVRAVSLDDFYAKDERVDFIKMDIQGAEMRALSGMSRTLERSPNVKVVSEFCPRLLRQAGSSAREYLDFWSTRGFRAYALKSDGTQEALSPEKLAAMAESSGYFNLFFSRD